MQVLRRRVVQFNVTLVASPQHPRAASASHIGQAGASFDRRFHMERFFRISESGTTLGREIFAGMSTFLTMAFIVAVNPMFL